MMKQLRMKTLALACALLTAISAAPQPAHAASGDIADLIKRAANVTAAVQEEAAVQQAAPAEDAVHEVVSAEPEFTKGVIIGGTINVRTGPSTNCERITQVTTGKFVTVLGTDNGWYQIQFDSTTGYVLGDYLREATDADSTIGAQIVNMAMAHLGTSYRSGGAAPGGFDCSGFTRYLYGQFGYSLPHSATSQYNNYGAYVAKENLQKGDLVFFSDSAHAIGHVAIYIGDGQIIHARYSLGRVNIDNLYSSYYTSHYVGAKRIA